MTALIVFAAKYVIALPVLVLLAYFVFSSPQGFAAAGVVERYFLCRSPICWTLGGVLYATRAVCRGPLYAACGAPADNAFLPTIHCWQPPSPTIVLYVNKRAGVLLWIVTLLIGPQSCCAGIHHVRHSASMLIALRPCLSANILSSLAPIVFGFIFIRRSVCLCNTYVHATIRIKSGAPCGGASLGVFASTLVHAVWYAPDAQVSDSGAEAAAPAGQGTNSQRIPSA